MTVLRIPTAKVFGTLLNPSRYKGAHGGRGSGKSHFFGGLGIEDALRFPGECGVGLRMVCVREVQKTLAQSAKRLLEDKIKGLGLGEPDGFRIYKDVISLPRDGIITFTGMQDHTAESIKSLEGFHRAWSEEAQTLSTRSLTLLRPTIREKDSELWFSWNPRRKTDPVDLLLRGGKPTNAEVVKANWSDNPWFPEVLNQERLDDLRDRPDSYDHVWEGGYVTAAEGAYFSRQLAIAKSENRICRLQRDPLMHCHAFWDIGGTGAKADACTIWIVQFVGKEIRVLDYYEAVGQELSDHIGWMIANDYTQDKTKVWLPHDGVKHDAVYRVTYQSETTKAGYKVEIMPNAGAGAADQRIQAVRRVFHNVWIDKERCAGGIDALGWYHEKKDEARGIGLGPEHDWSSHAADGFGAMALESERLTKAKKTKTRTAEPGGWMSL